MLYCICMCCIVYFHISFICSCTTDKHQKMVTSGVTELGPRDSYTLLLNIAWPNTRAVKVEQRWKNEFCNDTPKQRTDQTHRFTVNTEQYQNKKRIQRAFFLRYCVITITIISLIDFLWIITYTSNQFFTQVKKSWGLSLYVQLYKRFFSFTIDFKLQIFLLS